jgi:hypothetical protein
MGRVCIVLSSVDALRQAIELRQKGELDLLLAGPNLMVRSNEHAGILAAPEVDVCLVPADWVATAYVEDAPALTGRVRIWYAGVDDEYWIPKKCLEERRTALVYWKNSDPDLAQYVERTLRREGWPVVRIIYGDYSRRAYRAALSESRFAVFLSRSESQGLALAEAWAMDVPTLAWEPRDLVIGGRPYTAFSASPYLTAQVGARWTSEDDFERLLASLPARLPDFSPRAWIQKNMTDLLSAAEMDQLVNEHLAKKTPN